MFLARLPRISANWNEKYRPYSFQTLANISGNFQKISRKFLEILNFRKIYNPSFSAPPSFTVYASRPMVISRSYIVALERRRRLPRAFNFKHRRWHSNAEDGTISDKKLHYSKEHSASVLLSWCTL